MSYIRSFAWVVLSFVPLWILVEIRVMGLLMDANRRCPYVVLVAAIAVLCTLLACCAIVGKWLRAARKGKGDVEYEMEDCKERKTATVGFIIENVFPLFCFDCETSTGMILILAYFLILASVSARHRYLPSNVVLEWLGWSFYDCTLKCTSGQGKTENAVIVSREYPPSCDQPIPMAHLNNGTLLIARGAKKRCDES